MRSGAHNFIKRNITQKESILFGEINRINAIKQKEKNTEQDWHSRGFKFYPSAFETLNMCPKVYVESTVHEANHFKLESIYRMDMGSAVHALIQNKLVEHKSKLLYERPRLLEPEQEKKLEDLWPEVPIKDESGFSGRCDLVINKNDTPAIVDIKTTSLVPPQWEQQKQAPQTKHILQVRFYRYLYNLHKYWDRPVEWVGIAYINLLIPAGDSDGEIEFWFHLGKDEDLEIKDLIDNLSKHRKSYIDQFNQSCPTDTGECTYTKCPLHGGKND